MKLSINENAEVLFTPDFNIPEVEQPEIDIWEDLEALGFMFSAAANDVHTIHINACGENFKELHECANDLYDLLDSYADQCLEMCCENGHFINNINKATSLIGWQDRQIDGQPFKIKDGTQMMIDILHDVTMSISELYPDVPQDIQSTMDNWTRELNSKMNYFLNRVMYESVMRKNRNRNESVMSASVRNRRRKRAICEHLDKLKLGQSYTLFCQVEDHIDDYNCDTTTLKKGDYIIRDFQFGHLPNGGNKGYIPYKVIDIEYDRDEHSSGYWDARKRLHLFDGYEDFYIECYNERFNGMFHKLYKSSVEE